MVQLIDLLLPPACAGCARPGSPLCARCVASFRPPSIGADRFVAADAGVVVGDALVLGMAAFAYEGALRDALQRLKYGGARRVAAEVSAAALPVFQRLVAVVGSAALVPVPIHGERLRTRGYNQAALIASALAARTGLPTMEVLTRPRHTIRQHRLDRAARLHNLRGAMAIAAGARVPEAAIVVDDILTTSATLEACAAVLRAAGTERVYGFTIAREV